MTLPSTDVLFRPLTIGSLSLPNRIVMAPMSRYFAPGGIPGPANAEYYRRRAKGGVGLILSEGTAIDRPTAFNDLGIPLFHGDEALAGWRSVIESVHGAGGRMGPQLWHTGAAMGVSGWIPDVPVESPSGLVKADVRRGSTMSDAAIADTVMAYATAANDARRLGFDTVELHGAHGYLIDQFFWQDTNARTDLFGGRTIGERTRFAVEVICAVRAAVGPGFPLIFRVSQFKIQEYEARVASDPGQLAEWLEPLVDAGIDILDCSQRRFWEAEFPDVDGTDGLNLAGWAKKLTGAATISVGSVGLASDFLGNRAGGPTRSVGLERLVARMDREEFDLIAVGRALIANPDWPERVRSGDTSKLTRFGRDALNALF